MPASEEDQILVLGPERDPVKSIVACGLSRRGFLRLLALTGGTITISGLLSACGGDDDDDAASTANAAGSGMATTTSSPPLSEAMAATQTLRLPNTEPQKIDPNLATVGNEFLVTLALFDPLLSYDRDGAEIPLLADRWEVSDDGIMVTFHLRGGVVWTDGNPVTAGDFAYSFKRLCDPLTASEYATATYPIKGAQAYHTGESTDPSTIGVTAENDTTLTLELTGPAAYFLRVLSTWSFLPVPKAAVDAHAEKWVEPGNIVTCGPFMLESWNHDQDLTLVRNPTYWGEPARLEKIIMTITADPQLTSVPAYENDELDISAQVTSADIDRLRDDATLSNEIIPFPGSGTTMTFFDCGNTESPFFKKEVRQAFYLALDLPSLAANGLKGLFAPATVVTPPGIPGRNEAALPIGGPDRARELLAAAGYPNGEGFPDVTLTWPQIATYDTTAQVVQEMWRDELGVNVTLSRQEPAAHRAFFGSLTDLSIHYDFYIWQWGSDYEDPYNWFNILWQSDQDFFRTRWVNAEYDALVKEAAVEQDPAERVSLYEQAEVILMDEMPILPLFYFTFTFLVKPYVKDLGWRRVANERFLHRVWIAEH